MLNAIAPQFITFKDGKLGVNFGGYHAGVGIGGLLGKCIHKTMTSHSLLWRFCE
ncbi:hypothetical protein JYU34_017090 [Plutella xylostella]|uniref:Uncharacterized protein n=1 Tax=Plutella xylostella TaxID=51655 RepID=A0ABQ7Q1S9_PLUXY|nr:hypothetical protein JYU34_017090 [Plutella xylostella]